MSLARALTASLLGLGAPLGLAAQATTFTIRVENLTKGEILKLSNGKTAPFVIAPVLWVVHTENTNPLFTGGRVDAGKGLRTLAETGNPDPLSKSTAHDPGVVAVGADAKPVGATEGGPLPPGRVYEFTITAEPGQYLSLAAMFGQSNDWFYSNDRPIALFRGGKPVTGDMSPQVSLYDAGTEVDEEPGLGPNQGPRQKDPEAGVREKEPVAHAGGKWRIPPTAEVLRLTIAPQGGAMSSNK
ncbi:MAG TPA: spondin domain-containing protein [Gemmatimonadales bacterium]|nr:spondin domain-containing protein [Gemmatimonadales bacterium]